MTKNIDIEFVSVAEQVFAFMAKNCNDRKIVKLDLTPGYGVSLTAKVPELDTTYVVDLTEECVDLAALDENNECIEFDGCIVAGYEFDMNADTEALLAYRDSLLDFSEEE